MNLAYVLFPEINIESNKRSNFKKVFTVLFFILFVSLSFIILLKFYGGYIIEILYGKLYLEATNYIIILVASMMFVNINYVILISLLVDKNKYQYIIFIILSLVFGLYLLIYQVSALEFAYTFMTYNFVIFLLLISKFIVLNSINSKIKS